MTKDEEREEWMNAAMGKKKPDPLRLENRITYLEEQLDKLTDIIKAMSERIKDLAMTELIEDGQQFIQPPAIRTRKARIIVEDA